VACLVLVQPLASNSSQERIHVACINFYTMVIAWPHLVVLGWKLLALTSLMSLPTITSRYLTTYAFTFGVDLTQS
jgi:hypothetical protein